MEISIDNIGKEQDKYLRSFSKGQELWLTEKKLGEFLRNSVYMNDEIIYSQYKIFSYKVDYFVEDYDLVIEFQGYQHFTKTKIAYKDIQKVEKLRDNGYNVLEIPYFVQLTPKVLEFLFLLPTDEDDDLSNGFPHGFIHPKVTLPCDFCFLGTDRYEYFLDVYPNEVEEQCKKSVIKRSEIDKIPYWRY